jgi:urease accessory protein
VLVVRPCAEHGSPLDLLRAAYHLGNRHVALEMQLDRLHLQPDHLLAAMLRRMHLDVTEEQAPFEPELQALDDADHAHGHDHGDHDHGDHDHHGHHHPHRHDHDD